jgi:hypothetical protein
MAGKYSFVSARRYKGEIGTLGFYRKEVGKLCLTSQALGRLREKIMEEEGTGNPKGKSGKKVVEMGAKKK